MHKCKGCLDIYTGQQDKNKGRKILILLKCMQHLMPQISLTFLICGRANQDIFNTCRNPVRNYFHYRGKSITHRSPGPGEKWVHRQYRPCCPLQPPWWCSCSPARACSHRSSPWKSRLRSLWSYFPSSARPQPCRSETDRCIQPSLLITHALTTDDSAESCTSRSVFVMSKLTPLMSPVRISGPLVSRAMPTGLYWMLPGSKVAQASRTFLIVSPWYWQERRNRRLIKQRKMSLQTHHNGNACVTAERLWPYIILIPSLNTLNHTQLSNGQGVSRLAKLGYSLPHTTHTLVHNRVDTYVRASCDMRGHKVHLLEFDLLTMQKKSAVINHIRWVPLIRDVSGVTVIILITSLVDLVSVALHSRSLCWANPQGGVCLRVWNVC